MVNVVAAGNGRAGPAEGLGRKPFQRFRAVRRRTVLPGPRSSDTDEVRALLSDGRFQAAVRDLGRELGVSAEQALAESAGYLREMSAVQHPVFNEFWNRLSRWFTRGYDVVVDEENLAALRRLDRKHSLVFLISHRSYLDGFVLFPSLRAGGLSPYFGMAGLNLNFFPFGTVSRRTGHVYIRRSTSDAPIYRLALRSYLGQLVATKSNVVWSIEGGRSRTGKMRPPRYGLLRYLVDALEDFPDANPLLVPTSFMYDLLPVGEVGKLTAEARGHDKEPENIRWFLAYAKDAQRRLGRAYLDFGAPLPLREGLAKLTADGATGTLVERVALDVCHRITAATPVTATAAACVALLAADRALTLDEVLETVRPLARYLEARGWPIAGGANLTDGFTLRWALTQLTQSQVVIPYVGGEDTVWRIGENQHLVAAVYRNSAVHTLLVRAIAELTLLRLAELQEQPISRPSAAGQFAALAEALRLREILKFDFFFAHRDKFAEELAAELCVLADNDSTVTASEITPEQARTWLGGARPLVAHLVLRPFLDAYRVVARQLAALPDDEPVDEAWLIKACLKLAHQWALQGIVASHEAVSGELFRTALRLAGHLNLLTPGSPQLSQRRRQFAKELDDVAGALSRLAEYGRPPAVRP